MTLANSPSFNLMWIGVSVIHNAKNLDLVCLLCSELLYLRLLPYSSSYLQCLKEDLAFSTQIFLDAKDCTVEEEPDRSRGRHREKRTLCLLWVSQPRRDILVIKDSRLYRDPAWLLPSYLSEVTQSLLWLQRGLCSHGPSSYKLPDQSLTRQGESISV